MTVRRDLISSRLNHDPLLRIYTQMVVVFQSNPDSSLSPLHQFFNDQLHKIYHPIMATGAEAERAGCASLVEKFKMNNANPALWRWPRLHESPWTLACPGWQEFNNRRRAHREFTQPGGTVEMSIPAIQPSLPTSMYVRQSYADTYGHIWTAASVHYSGAVVNGQPGIVAIADDSTKTLAWKMPPGWRDRISRVNHQGEVYMLENPY
ncbi:hypothetical protein C8Q74DRAFT_677604 [Fomes fomentarius]|nr:hypothetical protein C8Q74DRAFT_677604 [Fomes fomentarius]